MYQLSSDSFVEILTPRCLMVSVEGGMGNSRKARFKLFLESCNSVDFVQLIK